MGCFGARSAKQTRLVSNSRHVFELHRTLHRSELNLNSDGIVIRDEISGSVTGGPALTATQEYPWGYADEVLKLFETATVPEPEFNVQDTQPQEPQTDDLWLDAGAAELAEFVGLPMDRVVCL